VVSLEHGDVASIKRALTVVPLYVRKTVDLYWARPHEHIHPPRPGAEIAPSIVHVAKTVAQENPFKSAGIIVNELISENVPNNEPYTALPNIDTVTQSQLPSTKATPQNFQFDIQDEVSLVITQVSLVSDNKLKHQKSSLFRNLHYYNVSFPH